MTGDESIDWARLAADCADLPELPEAPKVVARNSHLSAAALVNAVLADDGPAFIETAAAARRSDPEAAYLLMALARVAAACARVAADAHGRTPESLIEAIRNTLLIQNDGGK